MGEGQGDPARDQASMLAPLHTARVRSYCHHGLPRAYPPAPLLVCPAASQPCGPGSHCCPGPGYKQSARHCFWNRGRPCCTVRRWLVEGRAGRGRGPGRRHGAEGAEAEVGAMSSASGALAVEEFRDGGLVTSWRVGVQMWVGSADTRTAGGTYAHRTHAALHADRKFYYQDRTHKKGGPTVMTLRPISSLPLPFSGFAPKFMGGANPLVISLPIFMAMTLAPGPLGMPPHRCGKGRPQGCSASTLDGGAGTATPREW